MRSAVLLDLDGTLFASEELARLGFERTLNRLEREGWCPPGPRQPGLFRQVIGMTADELFAVLLPGSSPELRRKAAKMLEEAEMALLETEGALFPGAIETLSRLRGEGHPLFIVSNGGEAYVETVIDKHGLRGLLHDVYCAGKHKTKEKAELVGMILERGIAAAVMVGDRASDIEAARKNGIPSVGCAYGFGRPGELDGADEIIGDISELADAIRRIEVKRGGGTHA